MFRKARMQMEKEAREHPNANYHSQAHCNMAFNAEEQSAQRFKAIEE